MKKIIALLLTLCMTLGILTSCGGPSMEKAEKRLSFYEELAEAIKDGDDDKLEEIVDEIKAYGEEQSDIAKDLEDAEKDFNEDKQDLIKKLEECVEDEKISSGACYSFERNLNYASYYADYLETEEERQEIYDEIIAAYEEAVDLAKDKNNEGIFELGREFRDDYYEKYREASLASSEMDDKFGELDDEYGDKLMSAVRAVYSSAYTYEETYKSGMDKSFFTCNMDIDDLEEKFDF